MKRFELFSSSCRLPEKWTPCLYRTATTRRPQANDRGADNAEGDGSMYGIEAVLQTRNEQERRKSLIEKSLLLEVSSFLCFLINSGKVTLTIFIRLSIRLSKSRRRKNNLSNTTRTTTFWTIHKTRLRNQNSFAPFVSILLEQPKLWRRRDTVTAALIRFIKIASRNGC